MLIKNYSDQQIQINENTIRPLNHVYDEKGNRYRVVCIRYNYCNQKCIECKLASDLLYMQTREQESYDGQEYNYNIGYEETRNTLL